MKTNVTYLTKNFDVNYKKNAVHCVLRWELNLDKIPCAHVLYAMPEFNDFVDELVNTGLATIDYEKNSVIFVEHGVSFCSNSDEFNETIGRNLALTRAQKMAFRTAEWFYEVVGNMLLDTIECINTLNLNCMVSANNCKIHEHEITGHTMVDYNN